VKKKNKIEQAGRSQGATAEKKDRRFTGKESNFQKRTSPSFKEGQDKKRHRNEEGNRRALRKKKTNLLQEGGPSRIQKKTRGQKTLTKKKNKQVNEGGGLGEGKKAWSRKKKVQGVPGGKNSHKHVGRKQTEGQRGSVAKERVSTRPVKVQQKKKSRGAKGKKKTLQGTMKLRNESKQNETSLDTEEKEGLDGKNVRFPLIKKTQRKKSKFAKEKAAFRRIGAKQADSGDQGEGPGKGDDEQGTYYYRAKETEKISGTEGGSRLKRGQILGRSVDKSGEKAGTAKRGRRTGKFFFKRTKTLGRSVLRETFESLKKKRT